MNILLALIYLNIYNKTRHSNIYVANSRRPNGWTEFFCGHSLVAEGGGNIRNFFLKFCFHGQHRALQLILPV